MEQQNNIYLFGEAAFTFEPHLAQGGNNILEDGFYLKNILNRKSISYNAAFKSLLKDRFEKKRELKKISSMFENIPFGFSVFELWDK